MKRMMPLNKFTLTSILLLRKINGSEISSNDIEEIGRYINDNPEFENKVINKIKTLFDKSEKEFANSFFKIFRYFKLNTINDIFSYFIERKIDIKILSGIIDNSIDTGFVHLILKIFISGISGYKSTNGLLEYYFRWITKIPSINNDLVDKFLFFLSFSVFIHEKKNIDELKDDLLKTVTIFRKSLFDLAKNETINTMNSLINSKFEKEKSILIREKLDGILNMDFWTYTETINDITTCLNGYYDNIDSGEKNDTGALYTINDISNRAFKNFDINMNQFVENICDLISKLFDNSLEDNVANGECEIIAGHFDISEKNIVRAVFKKAVISKGILIKIDSVIKNRILHLLIDEDLKSNDFFTNEKSGNDRSSEINDGTGITTHQANSGLNPLDDPESVYNPRNEVQFYIDDIKFVIKKKEEDKFLIIKNGRNGNSTELQCDDMDSLKKELETSGMDNLTIEKNINKVKYLTAEGISTDNILTQDYFVQDEKLLDTAVEVVNEIKSGYNKEEAEEKKKDIADIAGDVFDDRKKFMMDKTKSRKIIKAAIEISLKEEDFEDL